VSCRGLKAWKQCVGCELGYELDGKGECLLRRRWGGKERWGGELKCICVVDAIGLAVRVLSEGCRELGGWVACLQDLPAFMEEGGVLRMRRLMKDSER